MPGKPRKNAARRNLILIAVLMLGVLGVVGASRFINSQRNAVLMLPEEHELRLTKRASPDNAMLFLADAIKALPVKPDAEASAHMPEEWRHARIPRAPAEEEMDAPRAKADYARLSDPSLATLCWVRRVDEDAEFLAYIRGCAAAHDLVKLALTKEFCLSLEVPRFQSISFDEKMMQLGRNLVALGRVQFVDAPTLESLQPLLDAIRLARMLSREDDMLHISQCIEIPALQQMRRIAEQQGRPALLAQALEGLGPAYVPREVLHMLWLDLDDLIGRQLKPSSLSSDEGFYRMQYFRVVQQLILAMKGHEEKLQQLAEQPTQAMKEWFAAHVARSFGASDASGSINRMLWALRRARELNAAYTATRIALALETWKAEHAQYPATLQELVPSHVPQLPAEADPKQALIYRSNAEAYVLYTIGDDGKDNSGAPETDRILAGAEGGLD